MILLIWYKVQTNMISDALNFCLISSSPTHRTIASSSDNDEFASSVSITFFSKLSFLADFYNWIKTNKALKWPWTFCHRFVIYGMWIENEAEQPLSLVLNSH